MFSLTQCEKYVLLNENKYLNKIGKGKFIKGLGVINLYVHFRT